MRTSGCKDVHLGAREPIQHGSRPTNVKQQKNVLKEEEEEGKENTKRSLLAYALWPSLFFPDNARYLLSEECVLTPHLEVVRDLGGSHHFYVKQTIKLCFCTNLHET